MRFLVDECTGPAVCSWLQLAGHDAVSVFDRALRGQDDETILTAAVNEDRILITNDKHFGAKIHREGRSHKGVILLRLDDETSANKIAVMKQLINEHGEALAGRFVVRSERSTRFFPRLGVTGA
jgi:predicted nuclease of predicted toxin-antitoxin system